MAASGPAAQARFNPTQMLEGRAHGRAHQAEEGDGAQGAPAPFAGFWKRGESQSYREAPGASTPLAPTARPLGESAAAPDQLADPLYAK